jgi:hypothetical protein
MKPCPSAEMLDALNCYSIILFMYLKTARTSQCSSVHYFWPHTFVSGSTSEFLKRVCLFHFWQTVWTTWKGDRGRCVCVCVGGGVCNTRECSNRHSAWAKELADDAHSSKTVWRSKPNSICVCTTSDWKDARVELWGSLQPSLVLRSPFCLFTRLYSDVSTDDII